VKSLVSLIVPGHKLRSYRIANVRKSPGRIIFEDWLVKQRFLLAFTVILACTLAAAQSEDTSAKAFTNSTGMRFVGIEPGTFLMGSENGEGDWDEKPVHKVTITQPFYISESEVTAEQFRLFRPEYPGHEDFNPYASGLSWHDATAFCRWLSEKEDTLYRLPTEAEWEYAARAGKRTAFWSGDRPTPTPASNLWGLRNIHKGPPEWCLDWHGPYPRQPQLDPVGPEYGWCKVVRGGGLDAFRWDEPYYRRCANRAAIAPTFAPPPAKMPDGMETRWIYRRDSDMPSRHPVGLRVVMAPMPKTAPLPFEPPALMRCVKQTAAKGGQGPDSGKPYYRVRRLFPHGLDMMNVGWKIGLEPGLYSYHHNSALAELPNGDMLAFYYNRDPRVGEREPSLSIAGIRRRYGAEQWDEPSPWPDFLDANDEAPIIWNDSGMLWVFWGCPRIKKSYPFQWTTSTDNGATWSPIRFPVFKSVIGPYSSQPINSVFRGPDGIIYLAVDGKAATSELFASADNGRTWFDTAGRTLGRHSSFVLLDDNRTILAYGGKNIDIDGFMPKNISTDWGRTWHVSASCFSRLGGGQRPSLIKLASGRLLYAGDLRHRTGTSDGFPPADKLPKGYIDRGGYVGLSNDNGESWFVRKLTGGGLLEDDGNEADVKSVGYVTASRSTDRLIHIVTTTELHITLNESWILHGCGGRASASMQPAEIVPGSVKQYREYHENGQLKVVWSAGIGADGRYLLHGTETWYYENPGEPRKHWEVEYKAGRKAGAETFWSPLGVVRWKRQHNDDGTSTWAIYDGQGKIKAESVWRGKKFIRCKLGHAQSEDKVQ